MSSVRNLANGAPMAGAEWSMFVAAHRAHVPRRSIRASHDRVLVFAPDPAVRLWIDHELFAEHVTTQVVEALVDVVTTLTLVAPPWPHVLIIDVASISPADVELLGTIRDAGWPGMVIAIGAPSTGMQRALGIDLVVDRSLACEALRTALKQIGERTAVPLRRVAR